MIIEINYNGKNYSNTDKLQFINDYSKARFINFKQVREGSENILFHIDNAIEIESNNILKYKNQVANDLSLNFTERLIKNWLILGTKEYILLLSNFKNELLKLQQDAPKKDELIQDVPIQNNLLSQSQLEQETIKATKYGFEILKNIDLFIYCIFEKYGKSESTRHVLIHDFGMKSTTVNNFSKNKSDHDHYGKMKNIIDTHTGIKSKFSQKK